MKKLTFMCLASLATVAAYASPLSPMSEKSPFLRVTKYPSTGRGRKPHKYRMPSVVTSEETKPLLLKRPMAQPTAAG